MRPTSPVPRCSRAPRSGARAPDAAPPRGAGFTFVEILFALALCAILTAVVGSSLITSLTTEQAALRVRDASALCDDLLVALQAGLDVSNVTAEAAATWQVTQADALTGPATNRVRWQVWEVSLVERPSVRHRFAIRE